VYFRRFNTTSLGDIILTFVAIAEIQYKLQVDRNASCCRLFFWRRSGLPHVVSDFQFHTWADV